MSRLSIEWSDMLAGACRTHRSSGATCSRDPVALIDRAERHAHESMPHSHVRAAARLGRAERHAHGSMSLLSIERSDMHSRQGRSIESCLATCGAEHGARIHRAERHERARIRGGIVRASVGSSQEAEQDLDDERRQLDPHEDHIPPGLAPLRLRPTRRNGNPCVRPVRRLIHGAELIGGHSTRR